MSLFGRYSPSSINSDFLERSPDRLSCNSNHQRFSPVEFDMDDKLTLQEMRNSGIHPCTPVANKTRLLPCRTFISTGSCCYGDRCVFLHDQGTVARPVFIKYLKKSKEDNSSDCFFWPMMPPHLVKTKMDNKNQPDINQAYLITSPHTSPNANMNHHAVFSMWEHFIDFLAADSLSVVVQPRAVPPSNPHHVFNRYTGKRRLPALVQLSQGTPFDGSSSVPVTASVPATFVSTSAPMVLSRFPPPVPSRGRDVSSSSSSSGTTMSSFGSFGHSTAPFEAKSNKAFTVGTSGRGLGAGGEGERYPTSSLSFSTSSSFHTGSTSSTRAVPPSLSSSFSSSSLSYSPPPYSLFV